MGFIHRAPNHSTEELLLLIVSMLSPAIAKQLCKSGKGRCLIFDVIQKTLFTKIKIYAVIHYRYPKVIYWSRYTQEKLERSYAHRHQRSQWIYYASQPRDAFRLCDEVFCRSPWWPSPMKPDVVDYI